MTENVRDDMTDTPDLEQIIAEHLVVASLASRIESGDVMEWYVKCDCGWKQHARNRSEALEAHTAHVVAAIRDSGLTVIETPTINHLGPHNTVASMYRGAADKLDRGYDVGGSNMRASIAHTLRDIAAQVAERNNRNV